MPAALAAAHIGHEIEHSNAFMGFLIGAAVGVALGVAIVAAAVAAPVTAGASLLVVAAVGGAVATTGGAALAGMAIGSLSKSPKGPIITGTANVFYGAGKKPAARTVLDTVACQDHGTKRLAQGSDSVFINLYPAVRDTDRTECDGEVKSDFVGIYIGAETATYLEIESEVPGWMVSVAEWMVYGGTAVALIFGGAFAFVSGSICGLMTFGVVTGLGFAGSYYGAIAGQIIGEALGGEKGGIIGSIIGGFAGGLIAGRAGLRISNRLFTGHPVDVATGEMFTLQDDFLISGTLPLSWQRFWISGSDENGALGHGWHHPLDGMIVETGEYAVLRRAQGRLVLLPPLQPGQCYYHRSERIFATRSADGWVIRDDQNLWHEMTPCPRHRGRFLLKKIADANHNKIAIERDAAGHIKRVIGSDGLEYLFRNDDLGRIQDIARRSGQTVQRLVSYTYDAAGDLVAVTDTEGAQFSYGYNSAHLMERETHRSGYSYHFRWNIAANRTEARCLETWGDGGVFVRRLKYDTENGVTTEIDGMGRETRHWWNERGLVYRTVTPMGHETLTEWNNFGERLSVTGPGGDKARMTHDGFGRETSFVTAEGAKTKNTFASDDPYDPRFFSISLLVDPAGAETQIEFDARGNPIATTDPLDYRQTVLRDPRGLPLALRDEDGVLERFSWTPEGRLGQMRSSKGGQISFVYDRLGRLTEQSTEGAGMQQVENDATGRLIRLTEADGTSQSLTYDVDGNLSAFVDEAGRRTSWDYAGFGLPVRRSNPDGTHLDYAYDSELNLVAIRNELGEVFQLEYDADQRLIAEIEFDGRRREYTLNSSGDVTLFRDGRREQKLSRDMMGRLIRRESTDQSWAQFGYDIAGRMTEAINENRAVTFGYDLRGDLIREVQDGLAIDHVVSARGQRKATFLPDGRLISFGWGQDSQLASITVADHPVITVQRDRMGRERSRSAGNILQHTDYDPQGRISQQKAWREGVSSPIFGREYAYGSTGVIAAIDDIIRGSAGFKHDAREQLLRVSGPEPELFSFDPAGRLLAGTETSRDASVVSGRLMMRGDSHYSYDDAGNRVLQKRGHAGSIVTKYGYDDMNQLISVAETAGRRRRETRFTYDALGRRVSKYHKESFTGLHPANDGDPVAEVVTRRDVTRFIWDDNVLLAESRSPANDDGSSVSGADQDPDPFAIVYIHEPESFRPAAQIRRHSADEEGEVLTYWLDQIGTPLEITNENGELVWQVALRAWGGIGRVFVETIENPIRFQGQYHDAETGLHYNRFRHYDPAAGWYLNPDPISWRGGLDLSGYVSDPLGWTDPLGLAGCPRPPRDPYSGNPQVTRGTFPHSRYSIQQARISRRDGFGYGAYNRQFNTWSRDYPKLNLNALTGKNSTWRPDVIGYNPKTNTIRLIEVVSPSQTTGQMLSKLRSLRNSIVANNPGIKVEILTFP